MDSSAKYTFILEQDAHSIVLDMRKVADHAIWVQAMAEAKKVLRCNTKTNHDCGFCGDATSSSLLITTRPSLTSKPLPLIAGPDYASQACLGREEALVDLHWQHGMYMYALRSNWASRAQSSLAESQSLASHQTKYPQLFESLVKQLCPLSFDWRRVESASPPHSSSSRAKTAIRHLERGGTPNLPQHIPNQQVKTQSPFRLMDLPMEIREMVFAEMTEPFQHVLCVDKVGQRWQQDFRQGDNRLNFTSDWWAGAQCVVLRYRSWADIPLLHVNREMRAFAIKRFGTPRETVADNYYSFPVDPTRDTVQVIRHDYRFMPLNFTDTRACTPHTITFSGWNDSEDAATRGPVLSRYHHPVGGMETLERLRQTRHLELAAVLLGNRLDVDYFRAAMGLFFRPIPNKNNHRQHHLSLLMDSVGFCGEKARHMDCNYSKFETMSTAYNAAEKTPENLPLIRNSPNKAWDVYSTKQIAFLELFLWDFDATTGITDSNITSNPRFTLGDFSDPQPGFQGLLRDKLATLEVRKGAAHTCLHRSAWKFQTSHDSGYILAEQNETPRRWPRQLGIYVGSPPNNNNPTAPPARDMQGRQVLTVNIPTKVMDRFISCRDGREVLGKCEF